MRRLWRDPAPRMCLMPQSQLLPLQGKQQQQELKRSGRRRVQPSSLCQAAQMLQTLVRWGLPSSLNSEAFAIQL